MTYDVTMEAGGQSLIMASTVARTQAIHEDEAVWQIATTIESQMGTAIDTVSLRAPAPHRRFELCTDPPRLSRMSSLIDCS